MRGYIYLIKCGKYYKIGRTEKNFQQRLSDIQTSNPEKIKIVFCAKVDSYKEIEESIHEHFKDKRVRGEWFELKCEEIEFAIKMIVQAIDLDNQIPIFYE